MTVQTCDAVLERRARPFAEGAGVLVRTQDDAAPRFAGHAAVFDSRTTIGDPFRWGWYEEIARTAFDATLADGDARFLVDHNPSLLVARVSAGDLHLATDAVGLAVDSDLDTEVSYVRDLVRNLEKRRVTGMSFGFYVVRDTWKTEKVSAEVGGKTVEIEVDVRVIEEVRLLEVSAVTFPAYEDTDAGVRASDAHEIRTARGEPARTRTRAELARLNTSPAPAGVRADVPGKDPETAPAARGFDWRPGDDRAAALKAYHRL